MKPTRRRNASILFAGAIALGLTLASCGGESPSDTAPSNPASLSTSNTAHKHDAPGETCFICDPEKRDGKRLWCTEHARYEDRCWECQPQLEEKGRLYCEEHSLYEDECFICHPELNEASDDDKNSMLDPSSGAAPALFCGEHDVPESECGICQPQLAAALEPGGQLKVRFESHESAAKAGVATVSAQEASAQAHISALLETSYNENALASITPLASGIVARVLVDVGDDVRSGDVLVELHSSDVAAAKSRFVSASVALALNKTALEREQRLATKNISSEKEVQEAQAAHTTAELVLATARQQLLNYGFTEAEVASIARERDTSTTLLVRAPFDGTLVERNAVPGEAAAPGLSLFALADLGEMWLELSIPADRAGLVAVGAQVAASFNDGADVPIRGELTWVGTAVDPRTRMLRARAVVANDKRTLRAGIFGKAQVFVGDASASVSVPRESVQNYESHPYVFVKLEDDLYSLRRVETIDDSFSDRVAVVAGLLPNEQVVSTGAFTVMSEFLKSRLGAGCTDD